jgi:hypothetical protein
MSCTSRARRTWQKKRSIPDSRDFVVVRGVEHYVIMIRRQSDGWAPPRPMAYGEVVCSRGAAEMRGGEPFLTLRGSAPPREPTRCDGAEGAVVKATRS